MKRRVVVEKRTGETPLEALSAWKKVNPEYKNVPASYAGRLDPMASGKLLLLLGEECKRQKSYTNLDKEYEIEVLLDVGSDTGDALGLITYAGQTTTADISRISEVLQREEGSRVRTYPKFSSKTVKGKPLFLYALEGKTGDIVIPEHEEHIYRIRMQGITSLSTSALSQRIDEFLSKVPKLDEPSKQLGADFRIDAVRRSWGEFFKKAGEREFVILLLRVECGSGTYMRSLAPRIGQSLGTEALALSIRRSKIGKYWRGFWLKKL